MEGVKEKKKKGGRPKKTVKRERTTGIRFSKTEHFIVEEKAKKAGLKLTAYIRQSAIESKITTRLTEEERLFVRQLIGFSNNINQIARACHEEGVLRAMAYFDRLRIQIDQLIKNLKL
jgi:Bacterial mobilisation protein (MobC)